MREVAKALGDDLSGYDNALACENQYRTTIGNKAALIVVDDVWSKSDIEPGFTAKRWSTSSQVTMGRTPRLAALVSTGGVEPAAKLE